MTDFETYFEMFIAEDGENSYQDWFAQQTEDDLIRIEREIEVAKETAEHDQEAYSKMNQ